MFTKSIFALFETTMEVYATANAGILGSGAASDGEPCAFPIAKARTSVSLS